jgi:hypothetical protein
MYHLKSYLPPRSNRKENILYSRIIPNGYTSLLWITAEHIPVSYIVSNDLRHHKKQYLTFDRRLSHKDGTLLNGVEYTYKNTECFCILDIYLYCGEQVHSLSWNEKYKLLYNLLRREYKPTPNTPFLGLPYTIDGYTAFIKAPISYKGHIQYLGETTIQQQPTELFKTIIATPKEDIYMIKGTTEIVMVNTYKLSVALNRLFRNIRENENLDTLEESDDEYDNPNEDKWLKPVEYTLQCVWNRKYRMYEIAYPIKKY